eukprot:TRINITY_DN256_c0_g1_i1.p1 TRINITY_DN256_c0_g1~~TRINITY_DN256_c0_g1_i1.p1  ORF type:complete len:408 (-),score=75.91 TRINITY_DN256_c0_g1_i1:644-1867(-)
MARDALLHGFMQQEKLYINGQYCHQFIHQNIVFVLSEGFDAVVTMIWSKNTHIIGNNKSTLQTQTQTQNQFQTPKLPVIEDYECMLDEQCIDEIVNNLIDGDIDIDIDDPLYPPLPLNPSTSNYTTNTKYNSPQIIPIQAQIDDPLALPDIKVNDALYHELNERVFGGKFKNKAELITQIQTAIHIHKVPMHYIGEQNEFCVWIDRFYVYCMKKDEWRLCDIFDYNQFQNEYGECHESLMTRNSSKRSIISDYSSCNTSKRSICTEVESTKHSKGEYHTIYLKPIIERMKTKTSAFASASKPVDTDFIIQIVDNCIKYGAKRQISKRTFEFKWKSYTIIMSKSLKTILDVTVSMNKDVITVHPDVVSIISKKCAIFGLFHHSEISKFGQNDSFIHYKKEWLSTAIYL